MSEMDDLLEVLRWAWPETEWYSGRAGAAVHARTPGIQYLKPSSLDDLARIERRVIEMGLGPTWARLLLLETKPGDPSTQLGWGPMCRVASADAAARLRALVAVARRSKEKK